MMTDDERKWVRHGQWATVIIIVCSLGAAAAFAADSPNWLPLTLLAISLASSIYGAMRPAPPSGRRARRRETEP